MTTALRGVIIRPLARADILTLAELSGRIGVESAADWSERIERSDSIVLTAERDGRLVGYAAGEVRRAFGRPTPSAWVDSFGVELAERGRGVGRALAVELLERLRVKGADHILTLVPLHDRTLDPFFRDLGFRDQPLVCLGRAL